MYVSPVTESWSSLTLIRIKPAQLMKTWKMKEMDASAKRSLSTTYPRSQTTYHNQLITTNNNPILLNHFQQMLSFSWSQAANKLYNIPMCERMRNTFVQIDAHFINASHKFYLECVAEFFFRKLTLQDESRVKPDTQNRQPEKQNTWRGWKFKLSKSSSILNSWENASKGSISRLAMDTACRWRGW